VWSAYYRAKAKWRKKRNDTIKDKKLKNKAIPVTGREGP
jgi:hypothetical protein